MDTSTAQENVTQVVVLSPATKIKVFGWIFAVLGVILNAVASISGFSTFFREKRIWSPFYSFYWWALVVEDFCLVLLAVMDKKALLGRAYVAVTGLFVYSTTQLQAAAWVLMDIHNPVGVDGATYTGLAFLLVANLALVTALGMEHYIKPKWSNDEALPTLDRETDTKALVPVSGHKRESVLVAIQKWLGLVVACVGVAGLVVALVANVDQDCDFACVRNWWIFSAQLLGFVLFITIEVILKAPSFRPVLTVILAIQIRMLEWSVIGQPGDGSDSVQGVQKAGVIIAIVVSYLLLLSLCGRIKTDGTPSSLILGGALLAMAGLGVFLKYRDLAFPDFVYPAEWQFTMYLLALIWITVSFTDRMPFLLNFRLPLVAFIAITIQWDSLFRHALSFCDEFTFDEYGNDDRDWSWGPLEDYLSSEESKKPGVQISPVLLVLSFLLIMIFMGSR